MLGKLRVIIFTFLIFGCVTIGKAQTFADLMPEIVKQINSQSVDDSRMAGAEWDGKNLIILVNLPSSEGLTFEDMESDDFRKFVISYGFGDMNASSMTDFKEVLTMLEASGIGMIIRFSLDGKPVDVPVRASDLIVGN